MKPNAFTDLSQKPELHGPRRAVGRPPARARRQVPLHELHAVPRSPTAAARSEAHDPLETVRLGH